MNIRKSLRSLHSQSLKKIELNPLDLQECPQSQSPNQNSILNKLLLQPPSLKLNSNKLSIDTAKKYQPKFAKPDLQNLIQQNINLKNLIHSHQQNSNQLKVKIIELQKKTKLLEKGLHKVQKNELDVLKQNPTISNTKPSPKPFLAHTNPYQTTPLETQQPKTTTVHTEILKKKIADLTAQNISAEKQLKFLKKLPNITVYEENDTQKEHLIAETIRLKSIISSLSEQPDNEQSEKFQNQFMRLMKEENEKLKATIRLLQNDKILLKSRQTIQNKLNSDLKKQIQQFKTKLLYKQSELEKINNENKNLLFKKTTQFRQEQEKKENELVSELRAKLVASENERVKLEQNNELYAEENTTLKEKEKNLTQENAEIEAKYDNLVKKLNEEIEELQFQLNNLKNDYMNLLNSGSIKKKKSLGVNKQSSTVSNQIHENFHPTSSLATEKLHLANNNSKTYSRPVKWEDLSLAMALLYLALEQNSFLSVDSLVKNVEESGFVKCGDLVGMFVEEPFKMSRKEAMKLARYICEDQSLPGNAKVLENENLTIESSLARNILSSSVQKMTEKLSEQFLVNWCRILKKTVKLPSIIKQHLHNKSHISREQFCGVINKSSRQKVEFEEYDYLMLQCIDVDLSGEDFVLRVERVLEFVDKALGVEEG